MNEVVPPDSVLACKVQEYFRSAPHPGVVSVYLYGSQARGGAHRESDLDVAVLLDRTRVLERGDRQELRVRLTSELIQATGHNEVDLIVLNDVPPGLGRAVLHHGRRLHCADEELDLAFAVDVQLRAADLDPFLRKMERIKLEALRR